MMTTVRPRTSVVANCVQIKKCYLASRLFLSADIPSGVKFAAPRFWNPRHISVDDGISVVQSRLRTEAEL